MFPDCVRRAWSDPHSTRFGEHALSQLQSSIPTCTKAFIFCTSEASPDSRQVKRGQSDHQRSLLSLVLSSERKSSLQSAVVVQCPLWAGCILGLFSNDLLKAHYSAWYIRLVNFIQELVFRKQQLSFLHLGFLFPEHHCTLRISWVFTAVVI